MRKISIILTGWTLLFANIGAISAEWQSSIGVERFDWREYDSNGGEIVHESGPRFFAELSNKREYTPRLGVTYSGRLYGASVDYDGELWDGTPFTGTTLYRGFSMEAMLEYKLTTGRHLFFDRDDLFLSFSLGYDDWIRELNGGLGYSEHYRVPYSKLGFLFDTNDRVRIQFGAKLPIVVSEQVDFSVFTTADSSEKLTDPELAPVARATLYASIDYGMAENWNFRFYYDHYLFDASPRENLLTASGNPVYYYDCGGDSGADFCVTDNGSDSLQVQQPKSDHRTIGMRFSFSY